MTNPINPNLRRGPAPGEGFLADVSDAEKSRRGRLGKSNSPWRNGPMCEGQNAARSYRKYKANAPKANP